MNNSYRTVMCFRGNDKFRSIEWITLMSRILLQEIGKEIDLTKQQSHEMCDLGEGGDTRTASGFGTF